MVDGLKGFPEAISAVFPETVVQTCIVHLIRYSMRFASWKERKAIAAALKPVYRPRTPRRPSRELEEFDQGPWGRKYPAIAQSWRRNWEQVIPFFAFAPEVRKIIYTTNAIESLNSQVRKAVRSKGHFPSDQAATKLIWLALRNISREVEEPTDLVACCQGAVGDPVRRTIRFERLINATGSHTEISDRPAFVLSASHCSAAARTRTSGAMWEIGSADRTMAASSVRYAISA